MGSGPSRPPSTAETEGRVELKGPGIKVKALAPNSQLYQWSSDVKTGGQQGSDRMETQCCPFPLRTCWGPRWQAGR